MNPRVAENRQAVDRDALRDRLVAGALHVAAGIVGAVPRQVDGAALGLERRPSQVGHGEVDGATNRGAVSEGSGCLGELVGEAARSGGAVDARPIDHDFLRAKPGPFDEADCNLAVRTGLDRVEHLPVGHRCGIAFSLELEFRMRDAARHVGGQHEQEVDLLGGTGERNLDRDEGDERESAANDWHHVYTHELISAEAGMRRSRLPGIEHIRSNMRGGAIIRESDELVVTRRPCGQVLGHPSADRRRGQGMAGRQKNTAVRVSNRWAKCRLHPIGERSARGSKAAVAPSPRLGLIT